MSETVDVIWPTLKDIFTLAQSDPIVHAALHIQQQRQAERGMLGLKLFALGVLLLALLAIWPWR